MFSMKKICKTGRAFGCQPKYSASNLNPTSPLKSELDPQLRRERNADSRAGAEEIPKCARGEEQLVAARHRTILRASRRIQADGSHVGDVVHGSGDRTDVRDVIVPWIVAIE